MTGIMEVYNKNRLQLTIIIQYFDRPHWFADSFDVYLDKN